MKMKNSLPAVAPIVGDHPVTALGDPLELSHPGTGQDQVSKETCVSRLEFLKRSDMPPRDDQEMHRGLWVGIFEHHSLIILMDDLGRDLPLRNPTKYTVVHSRLLCTPPALFLGSLGSCRSPDFPNRPANS